MCDHMYVYIKYFTINLNMAQISTSQFRVRKLSTQKKIRPKFKIYVFELCTLIPFLTLNFK